MHRSIMTTTALAAFSATVLFAAGAAQAVELEFMVSGEDSKIAVWTELIERYQEVAPDVTINMNQVGYNVIRDQLPVQLEAGTGPDMATVTSLGGLNPFYLDITPYVDDAYWEEAYGSVLPWYRAGNPDGIHGWHTEMTVTGPYVNRTLFEEAGVDLPEPGATWDEWADAAAEVQDNLGLYAGMVMDRSGHRFAGPAMSYGAQYFDDAGNFTVDEGFIDFAERMIEWHASGLMPPDIWPAAGGQTYANGNELFFGEEVPFYMSGSWNIGNVADTVADVFDWGVVPVPCGPAGCGVMPGGSGLVAFASTEHPEEVAAFIDWMAQTDIAREYYTRTFQIPAHTELQQSGLDYAGAGASGSVEEGLNLFAQMVGQAAIDTPQAFRAQGDPRNTVMFNATITYLPEVMNGDLTLEEALDNIREEIAN